MNRSANLVATLLAAVCFTLWSPTPASAHPDDATDPSVGFWAPHLMGNRSCAAPDHGHRCRWMAGPDRRYDRYGARYLRTAPVSGHVHCWRHLNESAADLVWCADGYRTLS